MLLHSTHALTQHPQTAAHACMQRALALLGTCTTHMSTILRFMLVPAVWEIAMAINECQQERMTEMTTLPYIYKTTSCC